MFPPAVTPLAEKPPAEVDQALRGRVNEFYTMMKNKDYRKAEGWIADDTKDYYYAGPKPDIRSFELLSVEFSDLAHAKALVRCTMPLVVAVQQCGIVARRGRRRGHRLDGQDR